MHPAKGTPKKTGAPRGAWWVGQRPKTKGGRKKQMTKVTYICHSAKKKAVTYFIII
jgi:hypothetical protein